MDAFGQNLRLRILQRRAGRVREHQTAILYDEISDHDFAGIVVARRTDADGDFLDRGTGTE